MITLIGNHHPLQDIGLKSLSSYLEFHDIPTRVIYMNKCGRITPETMEQILKITENSSMVGVSLMSKDLKIFLPMIKAIKANLNIPVVAGGIHVTALPNESLEFADFVCIGEGEEPMRQLYKTLKEGTDNYKIPNIGYKSGDKIVINPTTYVADPLDDLPFPDYSFKNSYLFSRQDDRIKKIPIEPDKKGEFFKNYTSFLFYSQRGCNFLCTYCSNSLYHKLAQKNKHRWHRTTSPKRIKEELRAHLRDLPFIKSIAINDDNFLIRPVEEIEEITNFIKKELNLPFTINATPTFVTEEKISILDKNGLTGIAFGVQSGSERILKEVYNRYVTKEQVLKAAEIISKYADQGLTADYGFILDNPYETEDDWKDSLNLYISLPQPKTLSLYSLEFFPNTELTNRAIKDGYLSSVSEQFNKDYRRDIKYSYANSLFLLNLKKVPGWLNKILLSDFLVKSTIAAPIRLILKNRHPVELLIKINNKLKYLFRKFFSYDAVKNIFG